MDLPPELISEFTKATESFGKTVSTLDAIAKLLANVHERNTASVPDIVNSQTGNSGTYILLVIASFALGVSVATSFSVQARMNKMEQRQDRQDDYVQATYMMAPELKKKIEETKK
jgi:uncharacterized protein HemX